MRRTPVYRRKRGPICARCATVTNINYRMCSLPATTQNICATPTSEGFYELLSRTVLGLQPYTETDARRVIEQIVTRRDHELTAVTDDAKAELLR
ncbi:MAG: hypothetical protein R2932_19015 [Caldilineaceae bacterium]